MPDSVLGIGKYSGKQNKMSLQANGGNYSMNRFIHLTNFVA